MRSWSAISDEYDHERPEYTLNDDGTFRLSAHRLGIDELGSLHFGIDLWRMRTITARFSAALANTWEVWYRCWFWS